MNDPSFKKHDGGKLRWSLLPIRAIEEIIKVLMKGAEKYDADNWRKGTDWSRYYDALNRHIKAFWEGEENDPEWGLSHLAHAGCCLLFLLTFQLTGKGTDDRYKESENETARRSASGRGDHRRREDDFGSSPR